MTAPSHRFTLIVLACLLGCGRGDANRAETRPPSSTAAGTTLLTDVTTALGLPADADWPDGTLAVAEIMGGGVAVFDYDDDGDLDILQVISPPPGHAADPAPNRLYQQQPDGRFVDVSVASGLADPGYGQGVAIGDTDQDGYPDVYFTNLGDDAFYHNNGDGTFTNRTASAGFRGEYWSSSAAFFDYDRDGDLDLYVVHYVVFDSTRTCWKNNVVPDYCGPSAFPTTVDTLYRNEGNGTFLDVTAAAGIHLSGSGLGVVPVDLTADGWLDVLVANDGMVNHLWVNQHDGTFTEEAVMRGLGFNGEGTPEGSMGIAVADLDDDGVLDVLMTHLERETNTLYLGSPEGLFTDGSAASGMSIVDLPFTAFGVATLDLDHDGHLDVAVVNGGVERTRRREISADEGFWEAYREPGLLFLNDGAGRLENVSARAGAFSSEWTLGRGLAVGDLDRDGDLDLVVGRLPGLRVYRNDAPPDTAHWLLVRCLAGKSDVPSALVTVAAGDRRMTRVALAGSGYLSSQDARAHFGLGTMASLDWLEVAWPDGARERFEIAGVDREVTVRRGAGTKE